MNIGKPTKVVTQKNTEVRTTTTIGRAKNKQREWEVAELFFNQKVQEKVEDERKKVR